MQEDQGHSTYLLYKQCLQSVVLSCKVEKYQYSGTITDSNMDYKNHLTKL